MFTDGRSGRGSRRGPLEGIKEGKEKTRRGVPERDRGGVSSAMGSLESAYLLGREGGGGKGELAGWEGRLENKRYNKGGGG